MKPLPICVVLFACVCLAQVGCVTTSSDDNVIRDKTLRDRLAFLKKSNDESPEPFPNPVKMAATWTPDTLIQSGRTPTRGFGGRIYFYDEKSRAVPVAGTLVVHGFDDTAEGTEDTAKRYEFTPEQFTNHFSQSDLGASYSIWIPWDAIGGNQRKISLVPSFRTLEGKMVQGIASTVLLPGQKTHDTEEQLAAKYAPQFHRYQEAMASGQTSGSMTTTTIARRKHERAPASEVITNPDTRPTMIAEIESLSSPKKPLWEGKIQPASIRRP